MKSERKHAGGSKRTGVSTLLRALALAVLLGFLAWWAFSGQWGHAAIDGVLIVVLLTQWWNERSKQVDDAHERPEQGIQAQVAIRICSLPVYRLGFGNHELW